MRYVLADIVEALRYEPEDCEFVSRWDSCSFSLTHFFPLFLLGSEINSAPKRYDYQGLKAAGA